MLRTHITVFVTGAAVMMLEILGTRVIGPFYGVSLFVWSALIAVTLVGLASGYAIGGVVADRKSGVRLSLFIAFAGVLTALIPAIKTPVLLATNTLGLRAGALASAFILFFAPLTILGMVSPIAIKRQVQSLDKLGRGAGAVYASGTIGSVVGTLLLGFVLLSRFRTTHILFAISALLFALALAVALWERNVRGRAAALAPTAALFVAGGCALFASRGAPASAASPFQTVFEDESYYGRIRVVDDAKRDLRWLLADASTISATRKKSGGAIFDYLILLERIPALHPAARSALVIGLGSGHLPTAFQKQGITADAIEIDPVVVHAAREYFAFDPPGKLLVGDARYLVRSLAANSYDLIVHDCFSGGTVPSHLLSVESIRDLKSLLKTDGLLALSFYGFSIENAATAGAAAAVGRTIAEVFPHTRVIVSAPGHALTDHIFLASDDSLRLAWETDQPDDPRDAARLALLREREREIPADAALVITDDFNPLEGLQAAKSEAYRQHMVDRIGIAELAR